MQVYERMKLAPGFYKVKMRKGGIFNTCHVLRVTVESNEKGIREKYFQIDHGDPQKVNPDEENHEIQQMEIIRKITVQNPLHYYHYNIKVTFEDQDGDYYEMNAKMIPVFDRIMKLFPGLQRKMTFEK